jgi:hypothetical protein
MREKFIKIIEGPSAEHSEALNPNWRRYCSHVFYGTGSTKHHVRMVVIISGPDDTVRGRDADGRYIEVRSVVGMRMATLQD